MSMGKPDIASNESLTVAPPGGIFISERAAMTEDLARRHRMAIRAAKIRDTSCQSDSPLLRPWSQFLKRGIDITISLPVVLFCLPFLCLVVKITQWMQSAGPMFYRQVRCGRDDRQFSILKFRTMHVPSLGTSDIDDNPEGRIFPLGQFLRNTKIDEIPQFVNVLLGSMSVVGPRPHHFEDCKKFEGVVKDYRLRSIAKPGITGLAQYREYRGAFEWNCVQSRVERDLKYINSWSQRIDLSLIAKTAIVVLLKLLSSPLATANAASTPDMVGNPALRVFDESAEFGPGVSVAELNDGGSPDRDRVAA